MSPDNRHPPTPAVRITAADRDHADAALHAAWLRGYADLMFEWENEHPPGTFGSGGLGLVASQLADHAYCVEHHTAARPTVKPSEQAG